MRLAVFTDMSQNHIHHIAACGYFILLNEKEIKHDIYLLDKIIHTDYAEIKSICLALEFIFLTLDESILYIDIFTDSKNIIKKKNGKFFVQYKKLIKKFNDKNIQVELKYVKGHSKNKYNNIIDESCRKYLREYLKETGKDKLIEIPLPGGKKMYV